MSVVSQESQVVCNVLPINEQFSRSAPQMVELVCVASPARGDTQFTSLKNDTSQIQKIRARRVQGF